MRYVSGIVLLLLLFITGWIVGQVFPTLYAIPFSITIVVFGSYFGMLYIAYGIKQTVVEVIYAFWPIASHKARSWAIFNDKGL